MANFLGLRNQHVNRTDSTKPDHFMLDFCNFNMEIWQFNIQKWAIPNLNQTATPASDYSAAASSSQKNIFF